MAVMLRPGFEVPMFEFRSPLAFKGAADEATGESFSVTLDTYGRCLTEVVMAVYSQFDEGAGSMVVELQHSNEADFSSATTHASTLAPTFSTGRFDHGIFKTADFGRYLRVRVATVVEAASVINFMAFLSHGRGGAAESDVPTPTFSV